MSYDLPRRRDGLLETTGRGFPERIVIPEAAPDADALRWRSLMPARSSPPGTIPLPGATARETHPKKIGTFLDDSGRPEVKQYPEPGPGDLPDALPPACRIDVTEFGARGVPDEFGGYFHRDDLYNENLLFVKPGAFTVPLREFQPDRGPVVALRLSVEPGTPAMLKPFAPFVFESTIFYARVIKWRALGSAHPTQRWPFGGPGPLWHVLTLSRDLKEFHDRWVHVVRDDRVPIQQAIDAAAEHNRAGLNRCSVYLPQGVYAIGVPYSQPADGFTVQDRENLEVDFSQGFPRSNHPIVLRSLTTLVGVGRGKTVLRYGAGAGQWDLRISHTPETRRHSGAWVLMNENHNMRVTSKIERDREISVSSLTIDGGMFENYEDLKRRGPSRHSHEASASGTSSCLALSRVDGVSLTDLELRNAGWGLSLSQQGDSRGNVTALNALRVDCHHNSYHGIGIPGPLRGARFVDCRIRSNRNGIDVEANRVTPLFYMEDLVFQNCYLNDNELTGFIWQAGDHPGGTVRGLKFIDTRFWNNGEHVIFWGFHTEFLDPAVFSKCRFSRSRNNGCLIQGGKGIFDDCMFCENALGDAANEGTDIAFVGLDRPFGVKVDQNGIAGPWRVAMDLEWIVRKCRFSPSARKSNPMMALIRSTDLDGEGQSKGTRPLIGIALMRPPDLNVQGKGIDLVRPGEALRNPGLKVDVTIDQCECRADRVESPLVFVRQMVPGGKTPSGNFSQRVTGMFGFEWVRNPGGEIADPNKGDLRAFALELPPFWRSGCDDLREPFPSSDAPGGWPR